MALIAGDTAAAASNRQDESVAVTVRDTRGMPMASVMVFGVDAATRRLAVVGQTDQLGRALLAVRPREHKFGIVSGTLGIVRFTVRGKNAIDLVVAAFRREADDRSPVDGSCLPFNPQKITFLPGRVIDQTGAALAGVRVTAVARESRRIVGETYTGRGGEFSLGLPAGQLEVCALSQGLRMTGVTARPPNSIDFVMSVNTPTETVRIVSGNEIITFRMDESSDPEYVPPPKIDALLRARYGTSLNDKILWGIIAQDEGGPDGVASSWRPLDSRGSYPTPPTSLAIRRNVLTKYWWLRLLQTAPANPARLAGW